MTTLVCARHDYRSPDWSYKKGFNLDNSVRWKRTIAVQITSGEKDSSDYNNVDYS